MKLQDLVLHDIMLAAGVHCDPGWRKDTSAILTYSEYCSAEGAGASKDAGRHQQTEAGLSGC